MIKTRINELFGIKHPIMSAPMAMHSSSSIAAAASNAGALGMFGGTSFAGPEWLKKEIDQTRALTDKPFGVGFITHLIPALPGLLELALDEKVPVIAFSFEDPTPYVAMAKAAGATVICQVQTIAHADMAVAAGADVLVAQGTEAGGHTGTMTLIPLLGEIKSAHPDIPLMAAGGISSGAAFAAALAAGAEGAWVGTAFLAAEECTDVSDGYKQALLESDGEDSVFSSVPDIIQGKQLGLPPWPEGIALRQRRDRFVDEWQGREVELLDHLDEVVAEYAAKEEETILMGQGVASVDAVKPAAEVVNSICGEAERILGSCGALLDS